MTRTIRAHFDGKVIVPDEPADVTDLPAGTPVTVYVREDPASKYAPKTTTEEQMAAWHEFIARAESTPVPHLPDEALRRENMYED